MPGLELRAAPRLPVGAETRVALHVGLGAGGCEQALGSPPRGEFWANRPSSLAKARMGRRACGGGMAARAPALRGRRRAIARR